MRWQDFQESEDGVGIIRMRNPDSWAIWAESEDEALDKAPADYGLVLAIGKDDEESGIPGQAYMVFKTSVDRDLYKSDWEDEMGGAEEGEEE